MSTADLAEPMLAVRSLSKFYVPTGWWHARQSVAAVRDVSFELRQRSTLAIVGASGAGKSTLARCIAGLEEPTSGEVLLHGRRIAKPGDAAVQLVFQDPGASLDPRFSVLEALAEPLRIRSGASKNLEPSQFLEPVGLSKAFLRRRTTQLSGGQKARLALARAVAALSTYQEPGLLILDESLSSLDLSIQAQVINLLIDLQNRYALTYILVSHDLSLAGHLSDEVLVMFDGEMVERGAPNALFHAPLHPHTKHLVRAALSISFRD